jgi:hypothetical protein
MSLYRIGWLERIPLRTPYPAVVARVGAILGSLPRGTELVLDYSGVGRGIADRFVFAGTTPIMVTITGGNTVGWAPGGGSVTVPKSTLVSRLVALMYSGNLLVHRDLKDWPVLRRELLNFRTEVTPSGQATWNAAAGSHDDLIIATALAGWRLEGRDTSNSGIFELYRQRAFETAGQVAPERYAVGVDIGQARDPTAICVMSRLERPAPEDQTDFVR